MPGARIVAVVVTYNRKNLLIECIPALQAQTVPVTDIICIDNASTDGTGELLFEKKFIRTNPVNKENGSDIYSIENSIHGLGENPRITFRYFRLPSNTGGAGGFHAGVKFAADIDCDWIWLMDDDAEPMPDALEKLAPHFADADVSVLSGTVKKKDGSIDINHRGFFNFRSFPTMKTQLPEDEYNAKVLDIGLISFVGPLIRKDAVMRAGLPKKEFFIHYDDFEYSLRLSREGKLRLIPDSVILHKDMAGTDKKKKSLLFFSYHKVPFRQLWLDYYNRRNSAFLGKTLYSAKGRFHFELFKRCFKTCAGILLFDDHKMRRIRFMINAYRDGLKGIFDNEKPRTLLYGPPPRDGR